MLLRNVRLGTISGERRVDALLDTEVTYCALCPPLLPSLSGSTKGIGSENER